MDCGLLNGRIYINGEFITGNLYIKDGKVNTISESYFKCKEEYDVAGKLVLPGFIDPHVHFQLTVGSHTSLDDFYSGSVKAALGGITTFIDFLDPVKTSSELEKAFIERRDLAKHSVVDYGLHSAIAQPTEPALALMKASTQKGMVTLKLFTTYSSSKRRTEDSYIEELLKCSKELGTRVLVHAENDSMIREGKGIWVRDHEKARPALSEITEVLKLAEMTKYTQGLLYIVHVSAGSTVKRLKENYRDLLHTQIILESCPHYFLWDASIYEKSQGYRFTMTPPLREKEEQSLLREGLGELDIIATDHCPFHENLKNKSFTSEIPMGVEGVQYAFSTMYQLYGKEIISKFTENPAKAHGLYPKKGNLLPGADGDVVIFDENSAYTLEDEASIYHQVAMGGKIERVFLRGRKIAEDGIFLGGQGEYVARRLIL